MTDRTRSRLAWIAFGVIVVTVGAALAFDVAAEKDLDLFGILVITFPVVGALIASRHPRNAVGWTMLGVGGAGAFDALLIAYSDYALTIRPGSLPSPDVALALSAPMWIPVIGLMGTYVILLFPDGRLPSPRWRPWAWLCAISLIVPFIGILVAPGSFEDAGYPGVENPLGIEALGSFLDALLPLLFLIPICIVGCAMALIQRFRRARGDERLQLKWLAASAGAAASIYLLAMVGSLAKDSPWTGADPTWLVIIQNLSVAAFILIPVAVGIAILRHRLYDIDVIINRTLVYGALTAALTLAYLLLVAVFQTVLRPLTGQSNLAVAGSTLVVAALFRPLRARIQAFIDRRFYRRKYDAGRTLEAFSARLRNETDLDTSTSELVELVNDVLQPMHVSLWLREADSPSFEPSTTG